MSICYRALERSIQPHNVQRKGAVVEVTFAHSVLLSTKLRASARVAPSSCL